MSNEQRLREALDRIQKQEPRFMDNRRLTEWDVRCYVCNAFSRNEKVGAHYQMVFEHEANCPVEIARAALAATESQGEAVCPVCSHEAHEANKCEKTFYDKDWSGVESRKCPCTFAAQPAPESGEGK